MNKIKALYHPYPVVPCIMIVKCEDKINGMSVAWHTPLSFSPPLYGVLVSPKRYTYELLIKGKTFTINFLDYSKKEWYAIFGRISGRERDKIKDFNVELIPSESIDTPYMKDAYAVYECKKIKQVKTGDHILFVGEIVEIHEKKEFFTEEGLPELKNLKPTFYLGKDHYFTFKKIGDIEKILP